jgi:ribosomal protein L11 methyltransferase
VRVRAHEAEIARARFVTLVPEGFEEVELGDELELRAYLDAEAETRLRAAFPSAEAVEVEPGWEERWRTFHHGVRAGGLWIGPPWEDPPPSVPVVVIEPARAFGTGAHPTTRACIELLARAPRGSLLDAGCGSGVLSVAAAKLGFGPIVALDVDEAAVEATRENALRNGVEIEILVADVLDDPLPSADLLVANIELAAIESLLSRWRGWRTIASGYFSHEAPVARGWSSDDRCELDGWAADRFLRLG